MTTELSVLAKLAEALQQRGKDLGRFLAFLDQPTSWWAIEAIAKIPTGVELRPPCISLPNLPPATLEQMQAITPKDPRPLNFSQAWIRIDRMGQDPHQSSPSVEMVFGTVLSYSWDKTRGVGSKEMVARMAPAQTALLGASCGLWLLEHQADPEVASAVEQLKLMANHYESCIQFRATTVFDNYGTERFLALYPTGKGLIPIWPRCREEGQFLMPGTLLAFNKAELGSLQLS